MYPDAIMVWRSRIHFCFWGNRRIPAADCIGGLSEFNWEQVAETPHCDWPRGPCILGIDYLRNGYFKDPKGYCWAFRIAAAETAEDIRILNTLPGLSDDPSAVGLLRVEEQVPITQQQYTVRNTVPTETL